MGGTWVPPANLVVMNDDCVGDHVVQPLLALGERHHDHAELSAVHETLSHDKRSPAGPVFRGDRLGCRMFGRKGENFMRIGLLVHVETS